ncbi:MAG: hypothetical protein ACXAC5_11930 [Promethearchaeota archaeon]|jgi:hypothetical protein
MPNPKDNLPDWLKEYERRFRETYLDLLQTSISRNQQHEEALIALRKAVDIASKLTLDFLRTNCDGKDFDEKEKDSAR